jgi:NAD(P)-dependent dehydrogenase (short-subunit alcohol dehydrogenase family)
MTLIPIDRLRERLPTGRRVPVPSLAGRRCLITGAASGIGLAVARAAAADGAELFLTDINAAGLEQAAAGLTQSGAVVRFAEAADLADYDAVVQLGVAVHRLTDSVDVVMNVAGISTWGPVEALEHRHWRRTVDVDLMGPIHVIEVFIPPMIAARRGGQLVNVSSAAGLFGLPWHAPYSAAKFGLRGVSEVLRFDLRRQRIGVTLVCPGAVKTPLVGTVEIVGVDRSHPRMAKLTGRFERHAVAPEHVAEKILAAVRRNRYLVLTSPDTVLGIFGQTFAPPLYRLVMRLANDQLVAAGRASLRR